MMRTRNRTVRAAAAVIAAVIAGTAACRSRPPAAAPNPAELARTVLMERVGTEGSEGPVFCRRDRICGSDVLPGFYRKRDFRPAWIDDRLALGDARAFIAALRQVDQDGLNPENYHLAAVGSLLAGIDAARKKSLGDVRPEDLADLEMLLTDGFLLCGSHLVHGQVNPETILSEWSIKGRVGDLAAALDKGLAAGDVPAALDSLRPANSFYRGIRKAYVEYAALAAAGGWPGFPPGPKLVKGDRDARVTVLRQILAAMGDLSQEPAPEPELFDDALEAGLKQFQDRHGLEPDGAVGAATAAALNTSAAERLKQLRANLERWRWITEELGDRFIMVNVAGYRVSVFEAGQAVLFMPAIVGRAYRQTPDFSGKISAITFNPAWNVPPKLAREDILPKLKKDPSYLKKKGFRVFESWSDGAREIDGAAVDWTQIKANGLSFKFRQDPGPQNALGRILFLFPNKFDVYMHDTPERWLFNQAVRDFSSGCIRIEKPLDLALYALGDNPSWTKEKILAIIASGETKVIPLRKPLPVHILYWTAWLGVDGRVQFRQDIYLRDAALVRALEEHAAATAR
ncbi:MAG: L,D-transpeptidase family protein [Candidatus Aminicenantales bacterium]